MHVPLLFWMNTITERLFALKPSGVAWTVCYLLFVVSFSSMLFKILEQPANRILKMRLSPTHLRKKIP